jgi:hypothetical protein
MEFPSSREELPMPVSFIERPSPDKATAEDIRQCQVRQRESGVQPPKINCSVSALRFFFIVMLDCPDLSLRLVLARYPRNLPAMLSMEEVGGCSRVSLLLWWGLTFRRRASQTSALWPSLCGPMVRDTTGQQQDLTVPEQGASMHAGVSDHPGPNRRSRLRGGSCCLPGW